MENEKMPNGSEIDWTRISTKQLTSEQKNIILHPDGAHARVLAVAGSGKTETLVMRIKYLVEQKNISPESIQILMFNRNIRIEFQERLNRPEDGVRGVSNRVNTFHSLSSIIRDYAIRFGLANGNRNLWESDEDPGEASNREKFSHTLHEAINELEKRKQIPADSVGKKEAEEAISAWKNALIQPADAGHRENPNLVKVYAAFEALREQKNGLTFDDFVPMAVELLEIHQSLRDRFSSSLRYIFVDEYQDVNYAQQRLIELLAGEHTDVMVIGDDDQTLYEWRGARPDYILKKYQLQFNNKPLKTYQLTNSFRFGPLIAQCAENSVQHNTIREKKSVVAHNFEQQAEIHLMYQGETEHKNSNRWLKEQIINLLSTGQARPNEIIILCRMYAQLSMLEAEFIGRVPYRIEGQAVFYKRHEAAVFLEYLRVALHYHTPLTDEIARSFGRIVNNPNRKIPRDILKTVEKAVEKGITLSAVLEQLANDPYSGLFKAQQENLLNLMYCLKKAHMHARAETPQPAGDLLEWIKDQVAYDSYLQNYFGKGDPSYERIEALDNFIAYANKSGLDTEKFLLHIASLDTTLGEDKNDQIVMTTVYQVKGKQYPYVIIPNCNEGYMPSRYELKNSIYDRSGKVKEAELSPGIENERRLFYVALTRATRAVFIGAASTEGQGAGPSRFLGEINLLPTQKGLETLASVLIYNKNSIETLFDGLKDQSYTLSLLRNFQKYIKAKLGSEQAHAMDNLIAKADASKPGAFQTTHSSRQLSANPSSTRKKWYED